MGPAAFWEKEESVSLICLENVDIHFTEGSLKYGNSVGVGKEYILF